MALLNAHFPELGNNISLRHKPDVAVNFLPFRVKKDLRGNGSDTEPVGLIAVFMHVNEDNIGLTPVRLPQLYKGPRHHLARDARVRPQVDHGDDPFGGHAVKILRLSGNRQGEGVQRQKQSASNQRYK